MSSDPSESQPSRKPRPRDIDGRAGATATRPVDRSAARHCRNGKHRQGLQCAAELEDENRRLVRQRDYFRALFHLDYRCPYAEEALGDGRFDENRPDEPGVR